MIAAVVVALVARGSSPTHGRVLLRGERVAGVGEALAGPNGRTLYIFGDDHPNDSTCTGGCLGGWPPLTVAAGDVVSLPAGWTGTLTTFVRPGGAHQVAIDGRPLYYFSYDGAPGVAEGQCSGDQWLVVAQSGPSAIWTSVGSRTVDQECHALS